MASYEDAYSRLIFWLKVTLPLIALAILSTLFLVSRAIDPSQPIRFADVDVDVIAREQIIGGPTFSGVTTDGAAITVSATSAKPGLDGSDGITAKDLRASIVTPDGIEILITARFGKIDSVSRTAELVDDVVLESSTGYLVRTDQIFASLTATEIFSGGTITAIGPLGQITAGQMVLRQKIDPESKSTYELVFKNGVKLIYDPKQ
ncbi:MAG: hypothetical protein ACU0DI_11915 [Paracoccaceae bacterium]